MLVSDEVITRVEDVLDELESIDGEMSQASACDQLGTAISQSIGRLRTGIEAARHQEANDVQH